MNDLKNNQSVIIKPCDRDGDICIMNTRDYLIKIHNTYQNTYKLLTHNPTNTIAHDAHTLIHYMHCQHIIDMTTMEFLPLPRNTCIPLFYGLPKTHKPNCPLCILVSGCDGPTGNLSSYITHFIQALTIFHHTLRTKNISSTALKILSPPTGALLVIADVMSLYTNIQHSTLLARIYPLPFIIKNIKKDLIYTCSNLLSKRTPHTETKILPIITPSLNIGKSFIVTINKSWNTIAGDGMLSAIWPSKLLSAYSKSSTPHKNMAYHNTTLHTATHIHLQKPKHTSKYNHSGYTILLPPANNSTQLITVMLTT